MDSIKGSQKRRAGVLLLTILFGVGLAWLGLPGMARGDVKEDWVRRYHGQAGSFNSPRAQAIDSHGNVYVTGFTTEPFIISRWVTIKYGPSGRKIWLRRYTGPNLSNNAEAIAVDGQGNVYVTGQSRSDLGNWTTIKYNSDGGLLWESSYVWTAGGNTGFPRAMVVDPGGNVYITGDVSGVCTTIKYGSDGKLLWESRHPSDLSYGSGYASGIVLDDRGNVYITGTIWDTFATIKYSPDGNKLWVRYSEIPSVYSDSRGIVLDNRSNVYITGTYWGRKGTKFNFATIKYDSAGKQLWVRRYNGPANGNDIADAIAVDGRGNVYVAGSSATSTIEYPDYDFVIIKYSSNGQCLWIRRYNVPNPWPIRWKDKSMVLDSQGNVYVTGTGGYGALYATLKCSPAGELLWLSGYQAGGGPRAIGVDRQNNVYVTGNDNNFDVSNFLTIKYKQSPRIWRQD